MRCVRASARLRALISASAVGGIAAVAALATGGPALGATCPPPPDSVFPFKPWGDDNSYVLTTGGSFEPGDAPWSLSGGATFVSDNAPNPLDPKSHAKSLSLPAGSSALSACVTAPKIVGLVRFFTRAVEAADTRLTVEVIVKGKTYQAGTVTPGADWAPSPLLTSDAPAYKGAVTYQVRLTAVGTGGPITVDDVYFDPFVSR
jgi:hypothetical protein